MSTNYVLTGSPGSGKTTVVKQTVDRLTDSGMTVGGFYSPERRANGERVGFDLVDIATGERSMLASVEREQGPTVGEYGVAVDAVDDFAARSLPDARAAADLVVVDEIAPMQLHSDAFVEELQLTLDSDHPTLAAIQSESTFEFVERVKQRRDVRLYKVTSENRGRLPERLATRLRDRS